jgi:hypothetical protein
MSFSWLPAYIDPFSGTILLQVIFAGVIGSIAFFRRALWRAGRMLFGIKPPQAPEAGAPQDEADA